jgi:hypothetical protein
MFEKASTVDLRLQRLRQRSALDVDRRERLVDLAHVAGRQRELGGRQVVVQMLDLRSAGDRHDEGLLDEQPGQRDTRRRGVLACGQVFQEVSRQPTRCSDSSTSMRYQPLWF